MKWLWLCGRDKRKRTQTKSFAVSRFLRDHQRLQCWWPHLFSEACCHCCDVNKPCGTLQGRGKLLFSFVDLMWSALYRMKSASAERHWSNSHISYCSRAVMNNCLIIINRFSYQKLENNQIIDCYSLHRLQMSCFVQASPKPRYNQIYQGVTRVLKSI